MRWMFLSRRPLAVLALGLVACSGDGGEKTDLTECEGKGDPVLQLGDGGLDGFAPWSDGTPVAIEQSGTTWGFRVELQTVGIDSTADVTSFVRYSLGAYPETTDAGATLVLQCPEEGPAWYGVFVPFDEVYQDDAAAAGLHGTELHLSGTITDQATDTASDDVEAILEVP